jgi:uncharacterized protein YndB with AHSA1/START domain
MKERSATHATFVIEPSYPTTPQRVFAALSDPAKKRRWFTVEQESKVDKFAMDFRVGGSERSSFRVQSVTCTNDTIYLDTVPGPANRDRLYDDARSEADLVVSSHRGDVANEAGNRTHLHRAGSFLRGRGWISNA